MLDIWATRNLYLLIDFFTYGPQSRHQYKLTLTHTHTRSETLRHASSRLIGFHFVVIAAEYTLAHFHAINLFDCRYKINNIQQYICVWTVKYSFLFDQKETWIQMEQNLLMTTVNIPNDNKKESKLTLTSPFNLSMSVWFLRPDSARQFIGDHFVSTTTMATKTTTTNKKMF